jgi:Zn-finger nucleic acid-binding protein
MTLVCPRCDNLLCVEVIGAEIPRRPDGPFRTAPPVDLKSSDGCEVDRCSSCGGIWFDG